MIDDIGFTCRVEPHLPPIHGHEPRLVQILTNLLNNAAKFSPPGGEITLSAGVAADAVEIVVSDNGMGISAAALPRIFDRYFQEAVTARRSGGLGIGLTLVKMLVESHGGRVSAHSDGAGLGATFTVRLPLDWDRSAEHLAHSASQDGRVTASTR